MKDGTRWVLRACPVFFVSFAWDDQLPKKFPAFWDWRIRNGGTLNPVKDQKNCNMCWAIVAAEAVAAGHKAKNSDKDLLELSSQELLDCCKEEEKQCYTYSIIKALKWIKSYGIMKEEEYPFKAHKCPCRHKIAKQKTLAVKIVDVQKVDHENENEILMRVKEQPIACGLIATKAFQELKGGIYEGSDELDLILQGKEKAYQHAILIIGFGYDEKEDKKYWIIKNSMAKIGECTDMPELLVSLVFQKAGLT